MICDICQEKPAIYGDGITWGRCSECQYKWEKEHGVEEPTIQEPVKGEGKMHEIIPGLVSIIIPVFNVNYSLFHYTGNCIGSIREHTDKSLDPYELIIVDNGSPIKVPGKDLGTRAQVYYSDKYIELEQNEGVTKAWNRGIRASQGEYIVLLNTDTQVYHDWLKNMKIALDKGGFDLVMAFPMYSLTEPFARALEADKIMKDLGPLPIEKAYSDFTDFSCVMIKRSLLDEIGLFDEDFFNYCSDVEFRDRMDAKGKKYTCLRIVPIHHISDATGYSIKETPEIMNKDKETYQRKKQLIKEPGSIVLSSGSFNFVRTDATGDKIFFIENDTRHAIADPDTYKALGGEFGKEKTISKEELNQYSIGEPVTLKTLEKYA